jgi:aminobenzoyl-glutamate transport protein
VLVGWYLTDKVVEPRLRTSPSMATPTRCRRWRRSDREERRGLLWGGIAFALGLVVLVLVGPRDSPMRSPEGELTASTAPLMQAIVPLIFLLFLIPGIVYGYGADGEDAPRHHQGDEQGDEHDGLLHRARLLRRALHCRVRPVEHRRPARAQGSRRAEGARPSRAGHDHRDHPAHRHGQPADRLRIGEVGAARPHLRPDADELGISPELTQAAYRVGDSTTNIITPLMPYFPLVVVFSQRYVKNTGIGTLVSMMLPYSVVFLITWTIFLIAYWLIGIPLGLQAPYVYP